MIRLYQIWYRFLTLTGYDWIDLMIFILFHLKKKSLRVSGPSAGSGGWGQACQRCRWHCPRLRHGRVSWSERWSSRWAPKKIGGLCGFRNLRNSNLHGKHMEHCGTHVDNPLELIGIGGTHVQSQMLLRLPGTGLPMMDTRRPSCFGQHRNRRRNMFNTHPYLTAFQPPRITPKNE
jgi:hypothetical protein